MSTTIEHDEAMCDDPARSGSRRRPTPGFGRARHRRRSGRRTARRHVLRRRRRGRRNDRPVRRRARPHPRVDLDERRHRGRRGRRRHRSRRPRRGGGRPPPPAGSGRSARQQRRDPRSRRTVVGGRARRVVDDDERQRPWSRAGHPARPAGHGRRWSRSHHQHHQPSRRPPLAAGVRVLGVQGRRRQAHREPGARDEPSRHRCVQRPSGAAPDRDLRDDRRPDPDERARSAHPATGR